MAGVGPMTQDWEPVVIRKKTPTPLPKRRLSTLLSRRAKSNPSENVCFLILLLDLRVSLSGLD
ncbi:hypothetical protein Bca52824_093311 [Brassica carinata]|uniref:Uncharacterized protein n=1 Tax=Brassica carinata TaxID=52824 RepID=A0A8X7P7P0_BRACI|nr:hypothetical protein Bca52824_093311 [Brassica carinata]